MYDEQQMPVPLKMGADDSALQWARSIKTKVDSTQNGGTREDRLTMITDKAMLVSMPTGIVAPFLTTRAGSSASSFSIYEQKGVQKWFKFSV